MTYRPSIDQRIAWTSGQLRAADAKVLVALWSCGDFETGRNCHPLWRTLVARSGLSRATVARSLARLEDPTQPGGPWIRATSRRHRHATTYDIQIDRLAIAPPKEQQMSMSPVLSPVRSESQNEMQPPDFESQIETQNQTESQNEMQPPEFESHFETPTSDPDLYLEERTHTPRAREEHEGQTPELALVGPVPPARCAHPHAHAWCEGRVHVPRDLHFEFLDRLDTRPGERPAEKSGRLVQFYAAEMARLPATQAVGDAYKFWKAAYVRWVTAEASRVVIERQPAPPRDAVWQQILARIEVKINRHAFYTWFRPLVMVTDHPTSTGRVIEVTKPGLDGGLFVAWLQKHYGDVVQAAVDEVRPGSRVVVIDAWAIESAADERDRQSG